MAFTGHTAWYCSSGKYASVTAWATGASISVADIRKQSGTPTSGNERVYVALNAFTTGASDPLTTFTRGVNITDNTTGHWMECTGIPAMNGDMTNTPNWTNGAKNTAITQGHVIQSNDGTKILICTTAGTSGNGAEPSWSATPGNTTADNTVTWTTLKAASGRFSAWASPHARLKNATATNWGGTVGLTIYVGNTHAATDATNISLVTTQLGTITSPARHLCVNEAGSQPPVSADLTTGASETVTGTNTLEYSLFGYVYGITCDMQATTGSVDMKFNVTPNSDMIFDNCTFKLSGNDASMGMNLGTQAGRKTFRDCTFVFGNAAQTISLGDWTNFENCTFAGTGTAPTNLFRIAPGSLVTHPHVTYVTGCDMSNITGNIFQFTSGQMHSFYMDGCKLNAAATIFTTGSPTVKNTGYAVASRSGSTAASVAAAAAMDMSGAVLPEFTAVRTGGANDNGTGYALKMTTGTNVGAQTTGIDALRSNTFGTYNKKTGADVAATVFGLVFSATLPTNGDLYADVWYLGASGNPQLSRKTSRVADILATPATLTTDNSAWDSVATARANGHVYSVGDIIKTASTPGSIFICTTGGTSAGSEPGGFTGAADGSSITDNTAVFRTNNRFKIALTLTGPQPQLVGAATARLFLVPASTTVYIDPFLKLV